MKKNLLIATMMMFGFGAFAQGTSAHQLNLATDSPVRFRTAAPAAGDRSVTCTPDTALYTYLKEVELYGGAAPVFYTTYYLLGEGMSQAFNLSAPATISGIDFYGKVKDIPNPSQTITVNVSLFSVDGAYMPVAPLATGTCLMTTTGEFRQVIFSAPVTISSNFAVVVTNPSATDTMQIYTNNATAATYGEALGYLTYGGSWYMNGDGVNGFGQDIEGLLSPIIEYNIVTDFTMSPAPTTMCLGTPLTFTNATTPTAILNNRMFNFRSFDTYWNTAPDSIYVWDMGDGSALQWSMNAAYTYPSAGLDTVTLYTLGGLFTSCVDYMEKFLDITPNAVSSFTQNAAASPLIAFTSTSTGAVTYAWDFGDGSPIDNTMNPSHTFAVGTWVVTLTVTSAGGCNTSVTTQNVTILATDIAGSSTGSFNVYPNPSNTGLFTIDMFASAKANIEVYNVIGELVYSTIVSASSASLDLSSVGAGVYTMKVNTNDKNLVKQIVITK